MLRSILAAGLLVALVTVSSASGSVATDVKPFTYKFQVTKVSMNATFTNGQATATTELHLSSLPKPKTLSWWGKRNTSNANGQAVAVIRLTGTAIYAGLDQACNGTVQIDTSRWRQPIFASLGLTNARDPVVTHPTISAAAGRFPLATIYSRRGGSCENGALPWWEGGTADRPVSVVHRAGFSFTAHYRKDIDDGSTLEWTVSMTVRRLGYRLIDCRYTQLC